MSKKLLVACFGMAGCTCICPAPQYTVDVSDQDSGMADYDAGLPPDDTLCRAACDRMAELGCSEGEPVPTGDTCYLDRDCQDGHKCDVEKKSCVQSCESFCVETHELDIGLNTSCLQQIKSCEEIDMCVQE